MGGYGAVILANIVRAAGIWIAVAGAALVAWYKFSPDLFDLLQSAHESILACKGDVNGLSTAPIGAVCAALAKLKVWWSWTSPVSFVLGPSWMFIPNTL